MDKDSLTRGGALSIAILEYVDRIHAGHDDALQRAFTTSLRENIPDIHVSAQEGRFLELLMKLIGAKRVVEVGTLAGYSAIRLARGMGAGGKVFTIESEPPHAAIARDNIRAAGLSERIEVLVGDGRTVLTELGSQGPFDAVFVDADKVSYHLYERWAAQHIRTGGLFIADNAFLFGELLGDTDRGRAMRACHEQAAKDFDTLCLGTPDGMLIGLKR